MAYTAPANVARTSRGTRAVHADAAGYRAYQILHTAFVILPLVAGVDKFFHLLTNWDKYLAPVIPSTLGVSTEMIMWGVGAIEIVAALLVAIAPRLGAYVVAAWLLGIIVNLAIHPTPYWDVAARDFGLMLGAMALGALSAWRSGVEPSQGPTPAP